MSGERTFAKQALIRERKPPKQRRCISLHIHTRHTRAPRRAQMCSLCRCPCLCGRRSGRDEGGRGGLPPGVGGGRERAAADAAKSRVRCFGGRSIKISAASAAANHATATQPNNTNPTHPCSHHTQAPHTQWSIRPSSHAWRPFAPGTCNLLRQTQNRKFDPLGGRWGWN